MILAQSFQKCMHREYYRGCCNGKCLNILWRKYCCCQSNLTWMFRFSYWQNIPSKFSLKRLGFKHNRCLCSCSGLLIDNCIDVSGVAYIIGRPTVSEVCHHCLCRASKLTSYFPYNAKCGQIVTTLQALNRKDGSAVNNSIDGSVCSWIQGFPLCSKIFLIFS